MGRGRTCAAATRRSPDGGRSMSATEAICQQTSWRERPLLTRFN
jgi:hypothetical protein